MTTTTSGAHSSIDSGFDPFGRDPELLARLRPSFDALLDRWFKVTVDGAALPKEGPAVLVCNHGGALPWDAVVLVAALERRAEREGNAGRAVRPLVEDPVITAPFLGTFLNRIGCVRASQDNAVRVLLRGDIAVVFPEGMQGLSKLYRQRTRHRLQRFGRGGFVRLAHKTKAPIVPVAVVGGEDTSPLLAKVELFFRGNDLLPYLPITPLFPWLGPAGLLPLPARWHIRIGEPIDVNAALPQRSDASSDVAVGQLAASIKERIQKDVDDIVASRKSAWSFGEGGEGEGAGSPPGGQ